MRLIYIYIYREREVGRECLCMYARLIVRKSERL